jgi:hypothetical protein
MSSEEPSVAGARGGFQSAQRNTGKNLRVLGGSCADSMLISCSTSPAERKSPLTKSYHIPLWYIKGSMTHLEKEKQKLVARIQTDSRQVDSIERSLTNDDDCADFLMLLTNYSCVPCTNDIVGALASVRDSRWIGEQHRKDAQIESCFVLTILRARSGRSILIRGRLFPQTLPYSEVPSGSCRP